MWMGLNRCYSYYRENQILHCHSRGTKWRLVPDNTYSYDSLFWTSCSLYKWIHNGLYYTFVWTVDWECPAQISILSLFIHSFPTQYEYILYIYIFQWPIDNNIPLLGLSLHYTSTQTEAVVHCFDWTHIFGISFVPKLDTPSLMALQCFHSLFIAFVPDPKWIIYVPKALLTLSWFESCGHIMIN